jgi:DNA-binding response OmpR family regulator
MREDTGGRSADISILAVVPAQRAAELKHLIAHTRWQLRLVNNVADVQAMLRTQAASVVLCESVLSDGTWADVLREANEISPPPLMIVLADTDESLWATVLSLGGYDVLVRPLNPSEVYTVVPMAWRHRRTQQEETICPHVRSVLRRFRQLNATRMLPPDSCRFDKPLAEYARHR